jgi:hypothetical protein
MVRPSAALQRPPVPEPEPTLRSNPAAAIGPTGLLTATIFLKATLGVGGTFCDRIPDPASARSGIPKSLQPTAEGTPGAR